MSTITHDDMKECFESVKPLNGYLIAEVTDKPSERMLTSGIIVQETAMDNDRPYLVVTELSEEAKTKFPFIMSGDIIEVMAGGKEINFVYGPEMEKLAIVDSKYIAAVYHRKPNTVIKNRPPRPKIITVSP